MTACAVVLIGQKSFESCDSFGGVFEALCGKASGNSKQNEQMEQAAQITVRLRGLGDVGCVRSSFRPFCVHAKDKHNFFGPIQSPRSF